jgi:hypothetical protein
LTDSVLAVRHSLSASGVTDHQISKVLAATSPTARLLLFGCRRIGGWRGRRRRATDHRKHQTADQHCKSTLRKFICFSPLVRWKLVR